MTIVRIPDLRVCKLRISFTSLSLAWGPQEWLARLVFKDEATGDGREMRGSVESRSEAQRKLKLLG